MDFTSLILEFLKDTPSFISVIMSTVAIFLLFLYHKKKNEIEERSLEETSHKHQIEVLMQEINLLSSELTQARAQLAEIHEQNIKLMEQLRKANMRINELEIILARRAQYCSQENSPNCFFRQ